MTPETEKLQTSTVEKITKFVLNKLFHQLLNISTMNHIYTETFYSEFSYIEIWFTEQSSELLEVEEGYSTQRLNPGTEFMSKAIDFYPLQKILAISINKIFLTPRKCRQQMHLGLHRRLQGLLQGALARIRENRRLQK